MRLYRLFNNMIFFEFRARISLSYTLMQPILANLYFGTSLTWMFLFRHNISMSVYFFPPPYYIYFNTKKFKAQLKLYASVQ